MQAEQIFRTCLKPSDQMELPVVLKSKFTLESLPYRIQVLKCKISFLIPWTMRLMLVSSDPNAFVATHVKRAVSVRSDRFTLRSLTTPLLRISSRIVYLGSALGSNRFPSRLHKIPMGFSPLASHCKMAGSPRRAV